MERLTEQRIGELEELKAKADATITPGFERTFEPKDFDEWNPEHAEMIAAIVSAFPTLAAESRKGLRQRWIPVSERLPEQGVRVLLSRGAVIIVGHYCGLSKNWSDGGSYALRAPTHWMPLPEPPQALTDGGTGG